MPSWWVVVSRNILIIREQYYSRLTILAFLASTNEPGLAQSIRYAYATALWMRTGRMGFLLVKRAHRRVSVVSACGLPLPMDAIIFFLIALSSTPASLIFINPSFTFFSMRLRLRTSQTEWNCASHRKENNNDRGKATSRLFRLWLLYWYHVLVPL